MSINISSFSWNRSFLCSILLPTGAQMACFMWWPLFTIQPHVGPWDATNAAHTGRQPPGHRHLSRQARGARKGHTLKVHGVSLPLTHPPFRASRVLGIPRRHTEKQALPKWWWDMCGQRLWAGETAHKMPKIGCRVKNIHKAYQEGSPHSFACSWASASWVSVYSSFYSDGQPLITVDLTLSVPRWAENRRWEWARWEGRGEESLYSQEYSEEATAASVLD